MMISAHGKLVRGVLMATVGAAAIACSAPAAAQVRDYNVPAESASKAIATLARQGNVQILLPGRTAKGVRTHAVTGSMSIEDALATMLAGTGLRAQKSGAQTWIIVPLGVASADGSTTTGREISPQLGDADAGSAEANNDIIVTGSRIRGAPPASPLVTISQEQMQNAGQRDLGEVIRSVPQNFNGGTNPQTGPRGSGSAGSTGASTLNLRGIGTDATLTLLNGHRLATNRAAGVDITSIPIAAVDRLEILTDGASALYGSDAVGGVANVIIKPTFNGLAVSALYGGSTDGGYEQKRFSAVAGQSWSSGGIIAAGGYADYGDITASQRLYANSTSPEGTLYPHQIRRNLLVSARQRLTPNLRFSVDLLYSSADSVSKNGFGAGPVMTSGLISSPTIRTFLVVPSLELSLGTWRVSTYGTYGIDKARSNQRYYSAGVNSTTITDCYCNKSSSAELSAEGPLFAMPAGPVRAAIGGGYRSNTTDTKQFTNGVVSGSAFASTDTVHYAFGEVEIPIISDPQSISFIHSLKGSAAVRYEDYGAVGSVATPKLGLIYEITSAFSLKTSWGQSFKAPQFAQRYARSQVVLNPATGYGALYPTGATYLYRVGGNPDLKPERANSVTVSAEYRPASNLRIGLSYYHIVFKDRVITPIPTTSGVLTNSLYTDLITPNPSAALQSAIIASVPQGLLFGTTAPYDPAKVVAVVDGRSVNATRQVISGVDFSIAYRFSISSVDRLNVSNATTYLDIVQTRVAGEPSVGITSDFFQPRHFNSRSGLTWEHRNFTLASFLNFGGGATYRTGTTRIDIDPDISVDLNARWTVPRLDNLSFALTVTNLLNDKPTTIPAAFNEPSFDSNTYAATGRVVTFSISKRW